MTLSSHATMLRLMGCRRRRGRALRHLDPEATALQFLNARLSVVCFLRWAEYMRMARLSRRKLDVSGTVGFAATYYPTHVLTWDA